ncbi:50S ribosomal protein L22 [Candidatus Parcubacteria bacterium]|nr:50S ribosomal protein L22 [Candidatus Parcubacteria bacterium]
MSITVKLKHLRIAPRKVRLVADLIRGKKIDEAQAILNFTVKKAVISLLKLLNSAVVSAKNDFQLDELNLYISKITVDEGPKLKRWRPRSRGQTAPIQKKTSHITLVLDEIEKGKKKKIVKKKTEEIKKEPAESPAGIQAGKERKPKVGFEKRPAFAKATAGEVEKSSKKVFRRKAF